ncbi:hypothetical protein AVEN_112927-1 [Araneus ventricosus]|uniref:Uncharacterized protein n=1 Tax=Araneus ventricosus TaxID=182803 RepID=A0A4Y2JPD1_ARAVE|nr:hypothetical protein AVEN_112927-1 [Araneus ventricosus]
MAKHTLDAHPSETSAAAPAGGVTPQEVFLHLAPARWSLRQASGLIGLNTSGTSKPDNFLTRPPVSAPVKGRVSLKTFYCCDDTLA